MFQLTAYVNVWKTAECHYLRMFALLLINERKFYVLELTVSSLIYSICVRSTRLHCGCLVVHDVSRRCRKSCIRIVGFLNSLPASHKFWRAIPFGLLFISHIIRADLCCHHTQDGTHPLPVDGSFPAHCTRYLDLRSSRISSALNHEPLCDR